ncbi:unnamed protein product [Lymnaea stagnalis]|uniref:Glycolipid transfer protein domain-containing protein n=1 Tax=Lymnaea stagnalis TaxID=6523 RepID=A0AAV2HII5_LYMST
MIVPTGYVTKRVKTLGLISLAVILILAFHFLNQRDGHDVNAHDSNEVKNHKKDSMSELDDKSVSSRDRKHNTEVDDVIIGENIETLTNLEGILDDNELDKKVGGQQWGKSVATASVKMAAHSRDGFDALRVYNLFSSCRKDNDVISLDCYVDAYEELCKLFRLFGTIFSFVTSDVEEKIVILRKYRKSEQANKYESIQSMLHFEVSQDLTKNKERPSGARTLLRLHRALEFISAFLLKLKESDNNVRFSTAATKAYDDTLAKHHPWLIKKAVHVAMYMLPSRQDLLKKMGVEDNEKGMGGISDLVVELNTIFKVTEDLYRKDNLLDLP